MYACIRCCESLSMSNSLQPHGQHHANISCPSPSPRVCSNSCPLSQWCHSTISSSVVPFSSRLQSFPASGSFPMSWLFSSGGQSIGSFSFSISPSNFSICAAKVSTYINPSNEYSGLISFRMDWSDLTNQGTLKRLLQHHSLKDQFFGARLSLWSNSHIHTWLLEKP